MRVIAIIPARMASSRFPGKPLVPLLGRSMLEHVYRRTALAEGLNDVFVATCDEEIGSAVEQFGGKWVMTAATHERASDRVAEAARSLAADVVVMVQGDEPMVVPSMIAEAVRPLRDDPSVQCVNLARRIETEEEFRDPNTIKIAIDQKGDALYFSREPIPTSRLNGFKQLPVYKQVCIIPFRRAMLETYASLTPTPLEKAESVDMLRLLEHGYRVRLVPTEVDTYAVDTEADRQRVEALMHSDALTQSYL
jgi:3-deoxy-manno-octulosonate cytidylyltransferase (CMP-KDO synthetase)